MLHNTPIIRVLQFTITNLIYNLQNLKLVEQSIYIYK